MITLYVYCKAFGLPDPSPFVMKGMMLLKLAKLPYQTNTHGYRNAPKGKLPYINDEGTIVADSTLIRLYLEKKYQIDFYPGLNQDQRAIAWAFEKLFEDHLYFMLTRSRWLDDENFAKGPAHFFDAIPPVMRQLVRMMVRRKVKQTLWLQGMSRYSDEELFTLANHALKSVATLLGEQLYFFGAKPCGLDATAFAFLSCILCPLFNSVLRNAAEQYPNLQAYTNRMMQEFFPDMAHEPSKHTV